MGKLEAKEKAKIEKFLNMESGYVGDFSNSTFASLFLESVGIDVYDEHSTYYAHSSKAKKMRHFWNKEDDSVIGKLLSDMCDAIEIHNIKQTYTNVNMYLFNDVKAIAERLKGADVSIDLPKMQDETLSTLMEHIQEQLARKAPELALDRLHTFATKMIREIAVKNGIQCVNPNGDHLPLHSVAGMLNKYYQASMQISEFSKNAIKMNLSLFSSYNDIRNKQSYAHDNVIMDKNEAEFVVRTVSAILTFIDKIEQQLNAPQPKNMTLLEIEQRLAKI